MRIPTSSFRRPIFVRRALLATGVVAAMAVPSAALQPAQADPPMDSTKPTSDIVSWGSGRLAGTHTLTLITGDVVVLQVTADGRQAAWVANPVRRDTEPLIYEQDGQVHVVPAQAQPYVASGALDEDLFNVTQLARSGYDDEATDELALLIEAPDVRSATVPDAPDGTDEVRTLDSVDAVSVTVAKDDIRTTWEDLRGPRPAPLDSTSARLADGVTVWLNEKVRATLDESVAQIGAPQAWADGYDGDGTTVAVLDTGYDPNHPDLADRVVDAKGFSTGSDTAVDGNGHGTHVAATVGGSGAASDGERKGVAPGTDLLIGKVLDDNGEGYTDQIIAGMQWAVDHDADVVNLSLGTVWASDGTDPLSQAVNDLTRSSGTLFVVAAGNSGPAEQTIGSPGAADLALTVGAVDKHDEPAAFSSRGPRLGDGAIKPELTAPGVDIVAARAAGTSLGNLLDEHYTSLNGTSMATPHVAGAAAILAQRHPDWSPAELKSRLVSTAETQRDQPVTFQGGGRLDVAAAIRNPVTVDTGTLSLGQLAHTADPVTKQLTYRNTSDRRIWLRLSSEVTSTGSDDHQRPALDLSRRLISIPARGTTTVEATLTPRRTETGGYAGQIVARPLGAHRTGRVHTTVAFTVNGPTRTVTVRAVDRAGQPASGPVDLWSADTGEWQRDSFRNGTVSFDAPDGLYTLVASIETGSTESIIAGNPELRVSGDRTVHLDGRDARPLRVSTPRDADLDAFDLMWHREVGNRSITMGATQGLNGEKVYLLGSPRARTGEFALTSEWQLAQPLLTARLAGSDGFRLTSPRLASPGYGGFCQCPAQTFMGEETLPLVDAGNGTAEAFAGVDADGAVALVSRDDVHGLTAQAEAADAAGAEVLLAYNTAVDRWIDEITDAPLPIYRVGRETGQELLGAIDRDPSRSLHLAGVRDATYQYNLAFAEKGRIPSGRSYRVSARSLAAVTSDYRHNSERMLRNEGWIPYFEDIDVANLITQSRNGPVVRTDYVNTAGVEWQRFAQPHMFLGTYYTSTAPTDYDKGRRYHQVWWGPLVRPVPQEAKSGSAAAVLRASYMPVTRFRDAIRVNLPHYSFGGTLTSSIYQTFGDQSELTLEREGEVVGTSSWPVAQYTVPPEEATYELSLDVVNGDENWSDTSVRTETTWRFHSGRTDESGSALPLVQVEYGLDADAYNALPADESYPLYLDPGYQPDASGPGHFRAVVEVSFDDGSTWAGVPVDRHQGQLVAQIPAASAPGFASVRVEVTDADGNQITQRIDRAWKIAAP